MDDKIENNPSFQEFGKNIKGAKAIKQIASFFAPFSKTAKNISNTLDGFDDLEKQFNVLSKSPDLFNHHFSELGWIAHESMNQDLMLECIELARKNEINKAEEKLADYYTSDNLKWLSRQLKGTPAFQKRYELIRLAYEDTIAKRFHSSVPIVLMIIDGGVNDIDKNKGFFTETTDLTAWDSIAAHSTGLSKLRDILNKGRNRTNTDEIFLPYRNGILHGRDLSYANKFVSAKCWLTLIAINDWAKALKKNKENPPKETKNLSFKESLSELKQTLSDYSQHQEKMKETSKHLDGWQKREIIINQDIPSHGSLSDYKDLTPEKDAVHFLNNWENKNYGGIAKQICYFKKDINISQEAGRVRKVFDKKNLKRFEITSVEDCAPAITEVMITVKYEFEHKDFETEIKLRMIYQNEKGENLVFGQEGGQWKFIDSFFFHKIEYPI